jgi:hypothetical protein
MMKPTGFARVNRMFARRDHDHSAPPQISRETSQFIVSLLNQYGRRT